MNNVETMAATDPYLVAAAGPTHPESAQIVSPKTPDQTFRGFSQNNVSEESSQDVSIPASTTLRDSKFMRLGRRSRPSIQVMNFDTPGDQQTPSIISNKPSSNLLGPAFGVPQKSPVPSSVLSKGDRNMLIPLGASIERSITPQDKIVYSQSIARPSSSLSMSSDSSSSDDEMPGETFDVLSEAGDVHSPETEAPTPYTTLSQKRPAAALNYGKVRVDTGNPQFSKVMDQHLWKMLIKDMMEPNGPYRIRDGQPPPAGVQRRVADMARRTWRDNPPMGSQNVAFPSSKDTRKRLRQLCRGNKPLTSSDVRRLQVRSPTPGQSMLDQLKANGGQRRMGSGAYDMRNIRVTLFPQASHSMRPNGPLTQLQTQSSEFFDNLRPWVESENSTSTNIMAGTQSHGPTHLAQNVGSLQDSQIPLGSPFTHQAQTWTSGMAKQHMTTIAQPRPQRPFATVNRLDPAIDLEEAERHRSNKRRAPFISEDAIRGSGSRSQEPLERPNFSATDGQRRVRPRGLTLEDIFVPRGSSFPFGGDGTNQHVGGASAATMPAAPLMGDRNSLAGYGLRSPFDGIGSRPTRARAMPRPAAALTIFSDASAGSSIDERLNNPIVRPSSEPVVTEAAGATTDESRDVSMGVSRQ